MHWFASLKIARKLILAFGLMVVLMISLGTFAVVQFAELYTPTYNVTSNWLPKIEAMASVSRDAVLLRRFELGYLLADTEDVKTTYQAVSRTSLPNTGH